MMNRVFRGPRREARRRQEGCGWRRKARGAVGGTVGSGSDGARHHGGSVGGEAEGRGPMAELEQRRRADDSKAHGHGSCGRARAW